jgi:hypothetical protein
MTGSNSTFAIGYHHPASRGNPEPLDHRSSSSVQIQTVASVRSYINVLTKYRGSRPNSEPSHCQRAMRPSCLVFIVCYCQATFGAFTLPQTFHGGSLEQNQHGSWCYYPTTRRRELACRTARAHLNAALQSHLRQNASVGYYNPAGERLGGPEFAIPAPPVGRIHLCVSGNSGSLPQTRCETVTRDNEIGSNLACTVARLQRNVSDGCYVPGEATIIP